MTTPALNILCLSFGRHSAPFSWVDTWGGTVGSKGRDSSALIKAMFQNPTPIPSALPCFISLPIALHHLTHFRRLSLFNLLPF